MDFALSEAQDAWVEEVRAFLREHFDTEAEAEARRRGNEASGPVLRAFRARMAERGWLERSPDPADKRSRILRLTPAGRTRLDELFRRTTQLLAERLADWSDDEVGRLTQLMTRLRDSFGDCRAVPRPASPAPERTTRTPASA